MILTWFFKTSATLSSSQRGESCHHELAIRAILDGILAANALLVGLVDWLGKMRPGRVWWGLMGSGEAIGRAWQVQVVGLALQYFEIFSMILKTEMVFCYQNCSSDREKLLKFEAEKLQNF